MLWNFLYGVTFTLLTLISRQMKFLSRARARASYTIKLSKYVGRTSLSSSSALALSALNNLLITEM